MIYICLFPVAKENAYQAYLKIEGFPIETLATELSSVYKNSSFGKNRMVHK